MRICLARLGDQPQRKLARSLGISDVTLRNWLREEKADRGERPGGLSGDEREEVQPLRDENAKLRMDRENLRKAAVFFAREDDEELRVYAPLVAKLRSEPVRPRDPSGDESGTVHPSHRKPLSVRAMDGKRVFLSGLDRNHSWLVGERAAGLEEADAGPEALVERRSCDASEAGDLLDRRLVEGALLEQPADGLHDLRSRPRRALGTATLPIDPR